MTSNASHERLKLEKISECSFWAAMSFIKYFVVSCLANSNKHFDNNYEGFKIIDIELFRKVSQPTKDQV